MLQLSFTSGWSLIRVPVSCMPVIWASASTPLCSSAWVLAADFATELAIARAISTSSGGDEQTGQNIHFRSRFCPGREVDGQEDRADESAAQQDEAWILTYRQKVDIWPSS